MASAKVSPLASIIAAEDYPALLDTEGAAQFVKLISSTEVQSRATRTIELKREELSEAVREHVVRIAEAAQDGDTRKLYDNCHEVRGLAGNAGLEHVGRIANGLCLYIDAASRAGIEIEDSIVRLHVDAIGRAARKSPDAAAYGAQVAKELSRLVAVRLKAVNAFATKRRGGR